MLTGSFCSAIFPKHNFKFGHVKSFGVPPLAPWPQFVPVNHTWTFWSCDPVRRPQTPTAHNSNRAGERNFPSAERQEERGSDGDQQHLRRAGACAAPAQDGAHHWPGEHLLHQAEGRTILRLHLEPFLNFLISFSSVFWFSFSRNLSLFFTLNFIIFIFYIYITKQIYL